ncbi:MAG: hypothetical protein ACLR2E_21285 [Lachnospiraceae bacterium]
MGTEDRIKALKGQLIVSCQALPQEPLHSSFIMGRMARAAKRAEPPESGPTRKRTSKRFRK